MAETVFAKYLSSEKGKTVLDNNPQTNRRCQMTQEEILLEDKRRFNQIKQLKGEGFVVARRAQLNIHGKNDLNLILTPLSGGLTKSNLKNTSRDALIEIILKAELNKLANMEQKKGGKKSYPGGGKRQPKMDATEKRDFLKDVENILVAAAGQDNVSIRAGNSFAVKLVNKKNGKARKAHVKLKGNKSVMISCKDYDGSHLHKEISSLTKKSIDTYRAELNETYKETK